ncbi:MAG: type I DNA topoisomerase [Kiritimatiellae bacterium]|nr:type I DNA topoisomerase [Kiritimatiellia bacterium]
MKKLFIVESPAKAKTIGKYLGGDFVVKSSVGHVRDLPKKGGLSIRIEPVAGREKAWTFTPTYEISEDKKTVVSDLRKAAKAADEIYLAPDPDREGEAIAWHLNEVLAKEAKGKSVHRVTYNEITKAAVLKAVENPGDIDLKRVEAQQARRILDRLVGFQVSPLLWKYLDYGRFLSAGRVQTAALRILVEREQEIRAFKPVPYWVLGVEARKAGTAGPDFRGRLARLDGAKPDVGDESLALDVVDDLAGASLSVTGVKTLPKTRHAYPPFTTSTLQQAASSVCGFSPHRTMSLAQKLYEQGFITYMRTDSVNVAAVARSAAAELIASTWGSAYVPEKPNFFKSKSGAQEAHEAIRPTDVSKRPGSVAGLDGAMAKLYDLIWRRFVASQMADARLAVRTVEMAPVKAALRHAYLFTASTTSVEFEGWLKAMPGATAKKKGDGEENSDEVDALPPLAVGDALDVLRWLSDRKETKPPARFSEAALVKALEENGVGRPSTYAQTIEVLVTRQYASRESRQLVPTRRGEDVCNWLVKAPDTFFNVGYTADMEAELDKVEEGAVRGEEMLSQFYADLVDWIGKHREPPPAKEKFVEMLALFDAVSAWHPGHKEGKREYDDRKFVASVRSQLQERPEALSERQLRFLARMAWTYRGQIAACGEKLASLGYADEVKDPQDDFACQFCFDVLDRVGGTDDDKFLSSLRAQFGRNRTLSPRQLAALVRSTLERCAALPDADAIRERLGKYAPADAEARVDDPVLGEMLEKFAGFSDWKAPVKRGKRTYDDREFAESLSSQYAQKHSLSVRQAMALRRMAWNYREAIPAFAENAERFGLASSAKKSGARRAKGGSKRKS